MIIPEEIAELHQRGVKKIFSPEDGVKMGLVGMIQYMLKACDFVPPASPKDFKDPTRIWLQCPTCQVRWGGKINLALSRANYDRTLELPELDMERLTAAFEFTRALKDTCVTHAHDS